MYIVSVPNRNSPPAILLRESYRENGKVKNRTLANLSSLPAKSIEILRRSLKGENCVSTEDGFKIIEDGSPNVIQNNMIFQLNYFKWLHLMNI